MIVFMFRNLAILVIFSLHSSFAFSSDSECEHYKAQSSNNYRSYEQFAKMANKAISQKQPYETSAKYWSLARNVVSQMADIPTIYEAFCDGKPR